ncbi:MAG: GGDEF domain-containing protein [Ilumatobacteraceae bacterium]
MAWVGSVLRGLLAPWSGRRHDRLATIATTDGLTGLRNRRSLDDDLDHHGRFGDEQTAFLMIDVDHFEAFKDTHGHAAGDEVLGAVATTIGRTVRSGDVTYRYGGEEFCVLLPRTDDATASLVAERIRRAIETSHLPGEARVTISVGVAAGRADDLSTLIARADGALYSAKDGGRNRIALG